MYYSDSYVNRHGGYSKGVEVKPMKMYMNPATGSVDDYDGWWYEDEDGKEVNAVDRGEVVEVVWDRQEGCWKEV